MIINQSVFIFPCLNLNNVNKFLPFGLGGTRKQLKAIESYAKYQQQKNTQHVRVQRERESLRLHGYGVDCTTTSVTVIMIMHKVHTGRTAAPAGTRAAGGGGGSFNPRAVPRRGDPPGPARRGP